MRHVVTAIAWIVLGAALAACGGDEGAPPTTQPASNDQTSTLPVSGSEPTSGEPWDLVWFGDSTMGGIDEGYGPVVEPYAARIAEVSGVEVMIHDLTMDKGPGTSAVAIGAALESRTDLRALVADAEVIGVYATPDFTPAGDMLGDACATTDATPRNPPPAFTVEDFEPYAEALRSVYDQIFALRQGRPTIIRAVDLYTPTIDQWTAAGVEPECTSGWEAMADTVRLVAAEYGVPTVLRYDAFNGLGHDEDPVDKGYVDVDDVHPSERGWAVLVEMLDALGYEPVTRPSE